MPNWWRRVRRELAPDSASRAGREGTASDQRGTQGQFTGRYVKDSNAGQPPLNLIGEQLISDCWRQSTRLKPRTGCGHWCCAAGKVFSAGANVALFAGMTAQPASPADPARSGSGASHQRLPFPTLARSTGRVWRWFELALFCDLIWAAEGTMLGLPETRLGDYSAGQRRRADRRVPAAGGALGGWAGIAYCPEFAAWGRSIACSPP
jgi:hypothetical protein